MPDWQAFQIPIPLSQIVEPIEAVLEVLMVLLDILKTILETIKVFLLGLLSPIYALVSAIIGLLIELIEALLATGLYLYADLPDPIHDPNFARVAGGFPGWIERFQGSLYDTKDFNRPQPNDLTTSGFILLLVDAANIITLIQGIKALMRLFGKAWKSPRYEAPANFKAIPVGTAGDPILNVASVFTKGPIATLELQWDLPTTVESHDPGFADAFTPLAAEFVPPNFMIEKSTDILPTTQKIDIATINDASSVGMVTVGTPTQVDSALASKFAKTDGTTVLSTQPLRDDQQEPFIKWMEYIKVDSTATDIIGTLTGSFRYLDSDVAVGHVYYYRIRAYSGDLNIDTSNNSISGFPTSYDALKDGTKHNSRIRFLEWPSTSSDEVVMGKPSAVVRAVVPPALDFDIFSSMIRLFKVAFSLDFHLPLPAPVPGQPPPKFDAQGVPVPPTPIDYIGLGSLTNVAGSLGGLSNNLLVGKLSALDAPGAAFDPNSIQQTTMPWQLFNVKRNATRLAGSVCAAMLQLGGTEAATFQTFMQGNLPRGPISTGGNLAGKAHLDDICIAFVTPDDAKDNNEAVVSTYTAAYNDSKLRQNVLTVITFLKNFTLGGVPPDWVSISPLRDLIPWAMQLLYDILAKIEALLDAFQGFLNEIIKFIDSLERKIDAMEKFIQFLIDILEFIQDLNFGVFVLAANNLSGDVSTWVSTISDAAGDIPPSGPGGYTAGFALAYALFDPGALATALETIFGG